MSGDPPPSLEYRPEDTGALPPMEDEQAYRMGEVRMGVSLCRREHAALTRPSRHCVRRSCCPATPRAWA